MISDLLLVIFDLRLDFIRESSITAATPWLGRLAFASVFIALIGWLIWIPSQKLQAGAELNDDGQVPSVARIRLLAIAIAAIQAGLYLLWS